LSYQRLFGILKFFCSNLELIDLFKELNQFFKIEGMLFETQFPNILDSLAWKLIEVNGFVVEVNLHVLNKTHALEKFWHHFRTGRNDNLDHQILEHFLLL
jgi:hypothetical protein